MQYLAKINKNVFFHINQSKTLFFFYQFWAKTKLFGTDEYGKLKSSGFGFKDNT